VTGADVRRMAHKYLDPDKMIVVVVGDRKTHEAPLRKIADLELRDVDGNRIPATAAR
jgi:hypothetical protein